MRVSWAATSALVGVYLLFVVRVDTRAVRDSSLSRIAFECPMIDCLDIAPILRRTPGRAPGRSGKGKPQKQGKGSGRYGDSSSDEEPGLPDEAVHLGSTSSVNKPDDPPKYPAGEPLRLDANPEKPMPKPEHPAGKPLRLEKDKKESKEPPAGTTANDNQDPEEGLTGPSEDYNRLMLKGVRLDEELSSAVINNQPDKVLPGKLSDLYDERDVQRGELIHDGDDLNEPLKEAGIDVANAEYRSNRIFSKSGRDDDREVVAAGKFFTEQGTIVGEERFAAHDVDPKMRPSDILFAQWTEFATQPHTLENFVDRSVLSRSAFETIVEAHRRCGKLANQPAVFGRQSSGPERDAFDALSGTDSLGSVIDMLKYHHQELGNKRIKEIHTYPYSYDSAFNKGRKSATILAKLEQF